MRFYFVTRKNFTKKTTKILLNAEDAHTRRQQERVPEGSKSQLLIQIIYLLHAFWAMTPPRTSLTRFRLQDWSALM